MDVRLSINSITPCFSHFGDEHPSEFHAGEIVGRQGRVVRSVEFEVIRDVRWYEYQISLEFPKGDPSEAAPQWDPGEYTVEIVGDGQVIRCDESFKPCNNEHYLITLRGPALNRFVARLVKIRSFWQSGALVVVDGNADHVFAGQIVTVGYDDGSDTVSVYGKQSTSDIDRKHLRAAPTVYQDHS